MGEPKDYSESNVQYESLYILRNVPLEIHRTVKDPDDLKHLPLNSKQDHVLVLGGDLTTGKQIIPSLPFFRS